jgi:hypothetical protein
MKDKRLATGLAILLTCPVFMHVNAQNSIFIKLNNGNQSNVALASLNKITFSGSNMLLNLNDASSNAFGISDINKITFGISSGINDTRNDDPLSVYPNPTNGFIKFSNLNEEATEIIIYRIDGAIAVRKTISATESVDVSNLSSGLYLVRIGNKTLKFTKQ